VKLVKIEVTIVGKGEKSMSQERYFLDEDTMECGGPQKEEWDKES
jgi:hypothetical protein